MENIEGRTNWARLNSWWEAHHKRGVTTRAISVRKDIFDGLLNEMYGFDILEEDLERSAIMTSRFIVLREDEE